MGRSNHCSGRMSQLWIGSRLGLLVISRGFVTKCFIISSSSDRSYIELNSTLAITKWLAARRRGTNSRVNRCNRNTNHLRITERKFYHWRAQIGVSVAFIIIILILSRSRPAAAHTVWCPFLLASGGIPKTKHRSAMIGYQLWLPCVYDCLSSMIGYRVSAITGGYGGYVWRIIEKFINVCNASSFLPSMIRGRNGSVDVSEVGTPCSLAVSEVEGRG